LGWLGFCSAAEFAVTHNVVSNESADVCLWQILLQKAVEAFSGQ
jgi:hypothetical protein